MLTPDEARVGLQNEIEKQLRRAEADIDHMLSIGERYYTLDHFTPEMCKQAVIDRIITAYHAVGWNVRQLTSVDQLHFSEKKGK